MTFLSVLDAFLWALREGHLATDPTASLEAPRRPRHLPRPIRADADRLAVARAIAAAPQPFRSNRSTCLSYDALHYQWAQVCAAAGLADAAVRPRYTLRLEIVQRVLGHRDPRSTQGYADLAENQLRAALEQR